MNDLAAHLASLILAEAPNWEEQFNGGAGHVVSVSDAAAVVARYIEHHYPQEWGFQIATIVPAGHTTFRASSQEDAEERARVAGGYPVHRTQPGWRRLEKPHVSDFDLLAHGPLTEVVEESTP